MGVLGCKICKKEGNNFKMSFCEWSFYLIWERIIYEEDIKIDREGKLSEYIGKGSIFR